MVSVHLLQYWSINPWLTNARLAKQAKEYEAWLPRHTQCVYFWQYTDGGNVKIGRTTNLAGRFKHFERRAGIEPGDMLLLFAQEGNKVLERQYHEKFAKYALGHEFFLPAPELLAFISKLQHDCKKIWPQPQLNLETHGKLWPEFASGPPFDHSIIESIFDGIWPPGGDGRGLTNTGPSCMV